jgi:hypothetical protein
MQTTYAPTFAFAIENYALDMNGTLTSENDAALVGALAEQGFIGSNSYSM